MNEASSSQPSACDQQHAFVRTAATRYKTAPHKFRLFQKCGVMPLRRRKSQGVRHPVAHLFCTQNQKPTPTNIAAHLHSYANAHPSLAPRNTSSFICSLLWTIVVRSQEQRDSTIRPKTQNPTMREHSNMQSTQIRNPCLRNTPQHSTITWHSTAMQPWRTCKPQDDSWVCVLLGTTLGRKICS